MLETLEHSIVGAGETTLERCHGCFEEIHEIAEIVFTYNMSNTNCFPCNLLEDDINVAGKKEIFCWLSLMFIVAA